MTIIYFIVALTLEVAIGTLIKSCPTVKESITSKRVKPKESKTTRTVLFSAPTETEEPLPPALPQEWPVQVMTEQPPQTASLGIKGEASPNDTSGSDSSDLASLPKRPERKKKRRRSRSASKGSFGSLGFTPSAKGVDLATLLVEQQ